MLILEVIALLISLGVARAAFPFGLRVVNGTRAEESEFPFMVSLRRAKTGRHSCGATILSPMWVLTAAHCVEASTPESLNIQYGSSTLSSDRGNIVGVSRISVNAGYYYPTILNDIALLKLERPLVFGPSVQPVRLPRMYQLTPIDETATVIGWGLNQSGGTVQKDLQKAELKVFSREVCSARHLMRIHPTNICAGVEGGGRGQCNGDSGGPLIVNGRQVGISSWSMKPCTVPPFPGVYTEVANYIDWIQWVMNDYFDK